MNNARIIRSQEEIDLAIKYLQEGLGVTRILMKENGVTEIKFDCEISEQFFWNELKK